MDFFQTGMGHKYYNNDFPAMVKNLERIAVALEKQNELAEAKLQKEIERKGECIED